MRLKKLIYYSDYSKITVFFFVILSIGSILRINYLNYDIPLTLDAFRYFLLGMDISILGNFPTYYNKANSGWPLFLSIVFQIFRSDNYLDYMIIQRICTVFFSIITAIPLYFLAKQFFKKEIAMIGVCFFIFSPYLIENSQLGINDSLFIFLMTVFLVLFFSQKKICVLGSFVILGFLTFIRYESLIMIFPSILIFFHKYKEIQFRKYVLIGIFLFLLVITPMAIWKDQMGIPDGVTTHIPSGVNVVINENSINSNSDDRFDVLRGIIKLAQYLGASLLPLCFIFIPYSIITLLKKENNSFRYLVIFGITSIVPAFYAYSRGYEEIRYVLFVSPVLIISALFLIEKLDLKVKRKNFISITLMILIIFGSVIYLDFRQPNNEYEIEAIQVAKYVSELPGKINDYGPESYYVEVMDLENYKFPILSTDIQFQKKIVNISGDTIEEILQKSREQQISYLGITESSMENNHVLKDIFYEEKYPFFSKIYDSKNNLTEFNVKIFRIDFGKVEFLE